MTYTPSKLLSFEDFLSQYGDDPRYELIDGELCDLEPTGPHESTDVYRLSVDTWGILAAAISIGANNHLGAIA